MSYFCHLIWFLFLHFQCWETAMSLTELLNLTCDSLDLVWFCGNVLLSLQITVFHLLLSSSCWKRAHTS